MVDEAIQNKVEHILCIAIDKASCQEVQQIADKFPLVTASAGIHPNVDADEQFTVDELIEVASHPKVIAIGETGLDYFAAKVT